MCWSVSQSRRLMKCSAVAVTSHTSWAMHFTQPVWPFWAVFSQLIAPASTSRPVRPCHSKEAVAKTNDVAVPSFWVCLFNFLTATATVVDPQVPYRHSACRTLPAKSQFKLAIFRDAADTWLPLLSYYSIPSKSAIVLTTSKDITSMACRPGATTQIYEAE